MRNRNVMGCTPTGKTTNHLSMDTFFDEMLNGFFGKDMKPVSHSLPSVNVIEDKENFNLEIVAPGWEKSDFDVNLEENILTIEAQKAEESKEKHEEKKFIRREFRTQSLKRSFSLPKNVKVEEIEAEYTGGILYISIPKVEKVKLSKKIEIA